MPTTSPSTRQRVLIFSLTESSREPRVLKQISVLKDHYALTTAGFGSAPDPDVPHIELESAPPPRGLFAIPGVYSLLVLLKQYAWLSRLFPRNRSALERLRGGSWDLIIAHDVATVPVAAKLDSRRGLLVDLHEYAPRQGEESRRWRIVEGGYATWVVRRFVTKATAVSTVSRGIVDEYRREFGIESELVINASPYRADIEPRPAHEPLRLVHSGGPSPARRLETMVQAVRDTKANVTLDFYLLEDDSAYMHGVRELAEGVDRITFHDPVPYAELIPTLARYDLGISLLAPINFNHVWALPNKFFDYIQARLAVVIGPSPEMQSIVEKYGVGAVAADFTPEALATLFESLETADVTRWKQNAAEHARELSSETQVKVWKQMVDRIFATDQRDPDDR